MADLFGPWVPTRWIVEVLDACRKAPQHRYLFLTKYPKRYLELDHMAPLPHEPMSFIQAAESSPLVTVEPNQKLSSCGSRAMWSSSKYRFGYYLAAGSGPMPEWVIIGAETGNRKEKVRPEYEWVQSIVSDCVTFNIPVFMKDSMKAIWPSKLLREFPLGLHLPGLPQHAAPSRRQVLYGLRNGVPPEG